MGNQCQSSPPLTILVPLWLIIISLVFSNRSKVLFTGFLQFKGNFVKEMHVEGVKSNMSFCSALHALHTYGTGSMDLSSMFYSSDCFIEKEKETSTIKFIMLGVLNLLGFILRICCIFMECGTPNLPIFAKRCISGENACP